MSNVIGFETIVENKKTVIPSCTEAIQKKVSTTPTEKVEPVEQKSTNVVKTTDNDDVLDKIIAMQKAGLTKLTREEAEIIRNAFGNNPISALDKYKKIIEKYINDGMAIGEHLHLMRTTKVYKLSHSRFADFVEAKFNMSRTRGIQLADGYELSTLVNTALGTKAITNECQAREVAKLKVLTSEGKEDRESTDKARVDLVRRMLESKQVISNSTIAQEVRMIMDKVWEKVCKDREAKKPVAKLQEEFGNGINSFSSKLLARISISSEAEKDGLKQDAIKKLEAAIAEIRKS